MTGGLAFFFQILKAVSQRRDAVLCREIHESCHGRLTKLRRPSQRNLIFAIKFKRDLRVHGLHNRNCSISYSPRYRCQRTMPVPRSRMTVEEFHRMLAAIAEGSEKLPDLPTESFSRESFYEDRLATPDSEP
jgi:hypothetical protein